jgi:hypothetical protein
MRWPSKRSIAHAGCAVLLVVLWSLASIAPAHAGDCGVPFNGKFTAFSDGQWAKTKERFHDETNVTSTWTVSTSCADYLDCAGEVSSDQGWSARARCASGMWVVARDVANWEPCPDGSAFTGAQKFKFISTDPSKFTGWDKTVGPSGACGVNRELTIELPFTLTKRN